MDDSIRERPESQTVDFNSTQPSIIRAKIMYQKNGNLKIFQQEIEKAIKSDRCTICGDPTYDDTKRCAEHKNTKLSGNWPTDKDIIPEYKHIEIERVLNQYLEQSTTQS